MKTAYIGLGSNLGDSIQILQEAWNALGKHPGIELKDLSSPYRTEPVGMESQLWFINAVGALTTSLDPEDLLEVLLSVEKEFGRVRGSQSHEYQDRTLDLDLLLYEERIYQSENLVIPHPEIENRLFVLYPLSEIEPQLIHPVLQRSIKSLLDLLLKNQGQQIAQKVKWPHDLDA